MNLIGELSSLGDPLRAGAIAEKVKAEIPAYKAFLAQQGVEISTSFVDLPHMDKQNYINAFPPSGCTVLQQKDIWTYFRSSGFDGTQIYWPQLRERYHTAPKRDMVYLQNNFDIAHKRTLALNGCYSGGWYGGEYFTMVFTQVALLPELEFHFISIGCEQRDLIDVILEKHEHYEQILIAAQPFTVRALRTYVKVHSISLPWHKVRFILAGEPFSETWRETFQNEVAVVAGATIAKEDPFILSYYGATDTGGLGFESRYGIALRRLIGSYPELASLFGFEHDVPALYHFSARDAYLEKVGNTYSITRWQGLPLVRYALGDRARFFNWDVVRSYFKSWRGFKKEDASKVFLVAQSPSNIPPIIALHGRAVGLHIFGHLLCEEDLITVIAALKFNVSFSGEFHAQLRHEPHQHIVLTLEIISESHRAGIDIVSLEQEVFELMCQRTPYIATVARDALNGIDAHTAPLFVVKLVTWPQLVRQYELTTKPKRLSDFAIAIP